MLLAAALCLLFTVGGIALSYGPELPAGATVIQLAGAAYLLALFGKWAFRRFRGNAGPALEEAPAQARRHERADHEQAANPWGNGTHAPGFRKG
jgi:hypothetical protein